MLQYSYLCACNVIVRMHVIVLVTEINLQFSDLMICMQVIPQNWLYFVFGLKSGFHLRSWWQKTSRVSSCQLRRWEIVRKHYLICCERMIATVVCNGWIVGNYRQLDGVCPIAINVSCSYKLFHRHSIPDQQDLITDVPTHDSPVHKQIMCQKEVPEGSPPVGNARTHTPPKTKTHTHTHTYLALPRLNSTRVWIVPESRLE